MEKIPETLEDIFKDELGVSLSDLFNKESLVLKNALIANLTMIDLGESYATANVIIEHDMSIRLIGPGEYGWQPKEHSKISFSLNGLEIKNRWSIPNLPTGFETQIKSLIKALK